MSDKPWKPTPYSPQVHAAIKALADGKANEGQQQTALNWIIEASDYYDLAYYPGDNGRRDTDFAQGKRFIGSQIIKLINTNVGGKP